MVQRLFDLTKWTTVEDGQVYWLNGAKVREVRLEINAPDIARLWIEAEGSERRFLALVEGRDAIEFVARGPVGLSIEGGPIEVYTIDGEDISVRAEDAVSHTKVMQRQRRSPEFDKVAAELRFNMERRLARQADEIRALLAARDQTQWAQPPASPVPGAARQEPQSPGSDEDVNPPSGSG